MDADFGDFNFDEEAIANMVAIANMEAQKEAQQSETSAKFQTASAVKPTGFSFGATGTGSVSFGTSNAPVVFGFSDQTSSNAGFSGSFGFGQKAPDVGPMTFGFGGSTSSSTPAATFGSGTFGNTFGAAPESQRKSLSELPDFSRSDEVPVGDVFVHGSGECDQLGLGDDIRERRKPTLLKELVGRQICEIAVGAMHVLCVSAGGGLYSWGCNDDGALGRVSSDGSDGRPADVEPNKVDMPNGVAVRKVSSGDCHSCALDDRGRVWLWGTYKDSNGYIGIVHKRKQETEVLEKSAEPTLVLEGCSVLASGANHTVALVNTLGTRKVVAWGSNATGQLGLFDNLGCGLAEKILSGSVEGLAARDGGGCEVSGEAVVRLLDTNGTEKGADKMTLQELQQALAKGASLVVQAPEREVPKAEKKNLLHPQQMSLSTAGVEASNVEAVFASAECTFITVNDGTVFGCGLNGDGQVGLGFASMAVQTLRPVARVQNASWLGGGLHSTAALAKGRVFTWGKAEECGLGLGDKVEQRWKSMSILKICSSLFILFRAGFERFCYVFLFCWMHIHYIIMLTFLTHVIHVVFFVGLRISRFWSCLESRRLSRRHVVNVVLGSIAVCFNIAGCSSARTTRSDRAAEYPVFALWWASHVGNFGGWRRFCLGLWLDTSAWQSTSWCAKSLR